MSGPRTRPIYLPMGGFTVVCTPHVIEQALARTGRAIVEFLDASSANLTDIYHQCTPDTCHYIPVDRFLLYAKRKYNTYRRRSELELISLTPNRHKHTENRKFAQEVAHDSVKTQSAFPWWFAEE